jgi:ATP-dependent Lhr-like helicase
MDVTGFHPAVAAWFARTHGQPTPPQARGWPAIQAGRHTLIAAPTGSGKTLAAFLAAIDGLVRQGQAGPLPDATQVLYVSPLKALSNDVQRNLQAPLAGIQGDLAARGHRPVEIRALVRSGDTPASARAAMLRRPPHILVTTPESLYLLLTSARGRALLAPVRTVIVDEIHALVGNKRGSHLALSLERLEALTGPQLVRIGLSATQHPIAEVARFLVGGCADGGAAPRPCAVIDAAGRRRLDLAVELPDSPLEAVMAGEVWGEVYERMARLVEQHRTTLVFVNTRRMAERVARALSERLGAEQVCSHHGSMAREHRLQAEQRLKAGQLRALVATASLELGIDIGAVDLVLQLGSTRTIAAFVQRAGRSRHHLGGVPKARLFPLTRDELVECAALLDAVRRGELDRLLMPPQPLDVLAQQIVAMAACEDWPLDALFQTVCRAYPYRGLARRDFDAVVEMLAQGFATARGRRGAYLHVDAVNGRVRGRRGARLAAITNGGAIPDSGDYDVVLEPTDTFLGTVNEDFAIESLPGDVFQLGNASWRILRVEAGRVKVADAQGQPPTLPFWLGEAPGRSAELSHSVARLRVAVERLLDGEAVEDPPPLPLADPLSDPLVAPPQGEPSGALPPREPFFRLTGQLELALPAEPLRAALPAAPAAGPASVAAGVPAPAPEPAPETAPALLPAVEWLRERLGLGPWAALQLVEYLAAARAALGVMPSQDTLVLERFFDEAGGMQLVLHAPFGSRLNRAWGLALRKRFCRAFNFELQAAATEDAIVFSLGPTHSFPLDEVFRYLHSRSVRPLLVQALLAAPMFPIRWRHNTNRALAVLRRQGDRKVAPHLQRMRAEDLLALAFPDQAACFENIQGDRQVPDHPLVNQTVRDCLEEVMDIAGLEALLAAMERGEKRLVGRDLTEPSPLALEVLNARPYAFLDDAPLEERRTRAVVQRRWLDPATAADLGALDADAIARVRQEAWPTVGNADELHDGLLTLGLLTRAEGLAGARAASSPGGGLAGDLAGGPEGSRAGSPDHGGGWAPLLAQLARDGRAAEMDSGTGAAFWVAAEWVAALRALYPQARLTPELHPPPVAAPREWTPEQALAEVLRGRMVCAGPATEAGLAALLACPQPAVAAALLTLEGEGLVLRGRFTPGAGEPEWCERGLLARIHRYTLTRLRQEIEPVSPADYLRFLFHWQRVEPEQRVSGPEGLAAVVSLLEGFEAPAAAWEAELLHARARDYDPEWLERLCRSGRVAWLRLSPPAAPGLRRWGPVGATPVTLLRRERLPLWAGRAARAESPALSSPAEAVRAHLAALGASFFADLAQGAGLLPTQLEEALGELVNAGLVTADGIEGLRALITPASKRPPVRQRGRLGSAAMEHAGRWSLLPWAAADAPPAPARPAEPLEDAALTLLRRWGVVFRRVLERERNAPPWHLLLRALRTLEARGTVRGGRFVNGMSGEQFALPDAVVSLREVRRRAADGRITVLSAADPLNLAGIVTPGARVPALTGNRVLFRDGVPVAALEGGALVPLTTLDEAGAWHLRRLLEAGAAG